LYVFYNCSFPLLSQYPAAAKANKTADFEGLRIFGVLTDLTAFQFYSYDPTVNEFSFDETLDVNVMRDVSFSDMIHGAYLIHWHV